MHREGKLNGIAAKNLDKLNAVKLGNIIIGFLETEQVGCSRPNSECRDDDCFYQNLLDPKPSKFKKNFSQRTQKLVRHASKSNIVSERRDSDSSVVSSVNELTDKRQKRELKKRAERRVKNSADAMDRLKIVSFDGAAEPELPLVIEEHYRKLLFEESVSPRDAYLTLIHSLTAYYSKQTWPDAENIEKCVKCFIGRHLLKDKRALDILHPEPSAAKVLEHKLQIFFQLGTLAEDPNISFRLNVQVLEEVVQKLQVILFSSDSSSAARTFLEEEIFDEFYEKIPNHLIILFEEMNLPLPPELELLNSKFEDEKEAIQVSPQINHHKASGSKIQTDTRKCLDRKGSIDNSSVPGIGGRKKAEGKKNRKKQRKEREKLRKIVPETPDSKRMPPSELRQQRSSAVAASVCRELNSVEDSPVRESPRAHPSTKAAKRNKRTEKLQQLLEKNSAKLTRRNSFYRSSSILHSKRMKSKSPEPKDRDKYFTELNRSTSCKKQSFSDQKTPDKGIGSLYKNYGTL